MPKPVVKNARAQYHRKHGGVHMPSSKYRRRLEAPNYLHEQLQRIATRESRTVESVAGELLATALQDYRPSWAQEITCRCSTSELGTFWSWRPRKRTGSANNYVGTEHLLLGLLVEEEGAASRYLVDRGVKLEDVRRTVERHIGHGDTPVLSWCRVLAEH